MIINILGGDGCGKSTQIENLCEWLKEYSKRDVKTLVKKSIFDKESFQESRIFGISYETLAHEILPLMKGESRALWLIYMNALLSDKCSDHEITVMDGYWHKHYATEAALGIDEEWLLDVCKFFKEPDLTILLDISPSKIVARGHKHNPYESGCDFHCSNESFLEHQNKVNKILKRLSLDNGYLIVDADKPVDVIQTEIRNCIKRNLEEKLKCRN